MIRIGQSNLKKIYYETINIGDAGWNPYPFTADIFNIAKARQAPSLSADNISLVQWEITSAGGQQYKGIQFESINALVDFCNNNLDHGINSFDHPFKLKCYDQIDKSIPKIEKVYGWNRIYAALRSGDGYGQYKSYARINGLSGFAQTAQQSRWDSINTTGASNWVVDAFAQFARFPDISGYNNADRLKDAIWFQSCAANLYSHIKPNNSFTSSKHMVDTPLGKRKIYNNNTGTVDNAEEYSYSAGIGPDGSGGSETLLPLVCAVGADQDIANNWEWFNLGEETLAVSLLHSERSHLMVYPIFSSRIAAGLFAIMPKPLGIDTVAINYYNLDTYQIEAVYRNVDRNITFKPVTIPAGPRRYSNANNDVTEIPLYNLLWHSGTTYAKRNDTLQPPKIDIRVRNKETGYISDHAPSEIVCNPRGDKSLFGNTFARFRWEVEPK